MQERAFLEVDGRWRHVYILRRFKQTDIFGGATDFVEYKMTANGDNRNIAEASKLQDKRPRRSRKVWA